MSGGPVVGGTVSALQDAAKASGGQVPVVARLAEIVTGAQALTPGMAR